MKFVSAAFGEEYRRFASGLATSFAEYMPGHELKMFGDGPVWGIDVHSLPVNHAPLGHWEMNIKRTSVAAASADTDDDVCWIDCDQLVLCDLTKYLQTGSINVVGYGCPGRERKIGRDLSVAQDDYILSGLFSLPRDMVSRYVEGDKETRTPAELHDKLLEQELVNRIVVRESARVFRVDRAHSDSIFGFVGGDHPSQTNEEFCSLGKRSDGTWWIGDRHLAVAAFTAECLRRHLMSGFAAMKTGGAREDLLRFYRQGH